MITYQRLSALSEINIKMLVVAQVVKDFCTTYTIWSLIAAVTAPQHYVVPSANLLLVHASQETALRFISILPENLYLSLQVTFFSSVF